MGRVALRACAVLALVLCPLTTVLPPAPPVGASGNSFGSVLAADTNCMTSVDARPDGGLIAERAVSGGGTCEWGNAGDIVGTDSAGSLAWTLPRLTSQSTVSGFVVAGDGTVVDVEQCLSSCAGSPGSPSPTAGYTIVVSRDGVRYWSRTIPWLNPLNPGFEDAGYRSLQTGSDVDATSLSPVFVGSDGLVYAYELRETHLCSGSTFLTCANLVLVGRSLIDGSEVRHQTIISTDQAAGQCNRGELSTDTGSLNLRSFPYSGGVVVKIGASPGNHGVCTAVVDFSGGQKTYTNAELGGDPYGNLSPTTSGDFYAIFIDGGCHPAFSDCTSPPWNLHISKLTRSGIEWSHALAVVDPSSDILASVHALPDGGVAFPYSADGHNGWTVLNASGSTRWTRTEPDIIPNASGSAAPSLPMLHAVDSAGRIVNLQGLQTTDQRNQCQTCRYPSFAGASYDATSGTVTDNVQVRARDCHDSNGNTIDGANLSLSASDFVLSSFGPVTAAGCPNPPYAWHGLGWATGRPFDPSGNAGVGPPSVTPTGQPGYVALGDSFSSGEGLGGYEKSSITGKTDPCHRSKSAFPALTDKATATPVVLPSVASRTYKACSGARTGQVASDQLDAIGSSTQYVTVTAGGDDGDASDPLGSLGPYWPKFSEVLKSCVKYDVLIDGIRARDPGYVSDEAATKCAGFLASTSYDDFAPLRERLMTLYRAMIDRAPNAKIEILTYPDLFPSSFTGLDNGGNCQVGQFHLPTTFPLPTAVVSGRAMYSNSDVAKFRDGQRNLNDSIRAAVSAVDSSGQHLKVVNLDTQLAGHTVSCGDKKRPQPFINGGGLAFGPLAQCLKKSTNLFDAIGTCRPAAKENSFHPNGAGHKAMASSVAAAFAGW